MNAVTLQGSCPAATPRCCAASHQVRGNTHVPSSARASYKSAMACCTGCRWNYVFCRLTHSVCVDLLEHNGCTHHVECLSATALAEHGCSAATLVAEYADAAVEITQLPLVSGLQHVVFCTAASYIKTSCTLLTRVPCQSLQGLGEPKGLLCIRCNSNAEHW